MKGLEAADPKKRALGKSFATYAFDDFCTPHIFKHTLGGAPPDSQCWKDLLNIHFPAFCKKFDERLAACGTKYLGGDSITEHDFIVGAMFTNMFCNPANPMAAQWKAAMEKCPQRVKTYGQCFMADMKPYLDSRPVSPF